MADGVTADPGSLGAVFQTALFAWSGESMNSQGGFQGILTGSEGSWTYSLILGGAGAVAAGVQRVTLASDDPAVALLTTIDSDTGSIVTTTAVIANDTTSIDGKITACDTGAVVLASGTVTTVSTVTNLAQMGGAALAMNEGALGVGVQRVSLATDDDAVAHLATIAGDTTSLDGKVTACNTGAVTISAALPAGNNNIGNFDIVSLPAGNLGQQAMAASLSIVPASDITDATYIGDVKFGEPLPAGTNNIGDVDVLTLPGVAGDVASDSVDSGSPVKIGMKAVTELPTGVAAADRTDALSDIHGRQLVTHAPQEDFVTGQSIDITGTATTAVVAAPAATYKLAVTDFMVTNSDATTGTVVKLTDGSGGTVLWRQYARQDGGGFSKTLKTPFILSAATALHAINETTGATVQVSASGYLTR